MTSHYYQVISNHLATLIEASHNVCHASNLPNNQVTELTLTLIMVFVSIEIIYAIKVLISYHPTFQRAYCPLGSSDIL